MKIKVWGARGSLTTPGQETIRYGGNTTCLEIRSASRSQIALVDAGSGLRNAGKELIKDADLRDICFFFTHSHWDHMIGFPFFAPAYSPRYTISLCGGPKAQDYLHNYLAHQMEAPFFPVEFHHLKAKFVFGCDCPKRCSEGLMEVVPILLNHPNGGYGFKFIEKGKVFVFLTDNELGYQHPGGLARAEYVEFCRGADLLFHDAQYTDEDYQETCGWGHSTFSDATSLAIEAGVKTFGIFHHDPDRTDDDLDRQIELCRKRIREAGSSTECVGVAEGMTFDL
jgi:phosphoribosyl 1,2-cyclic phosphodiesterase